MKRFLCVLTLVAMMAAALAGCAPKAAPTPTPTPAATKPGTGKKVVFLVSGTLGDKSFFDSANEGMKRIESELGCTTKVVEMGIDPSKWEPTLTDVSGQDWDLIIVGTWQMQEQLQNVAPKFPNKKYVIFDTSVDYTKAKYENVYSVMYKQNEGSYLAGVLAAAVTTSKMPKANAEKLIGFLGGQDIAVINDFLVGYVQGAQSVVPDIKVAISYVNSFTDAAKAKEMCLAQYNMGCDIGFNVAGGAGLGQLDAAKEKDKYAIGVDSDQAMLFKGTDATKSNLTLSSMMKRVDNSLVRAAKLWLDGKLPFGKAETLGLTDDAVGLVENEFYKANVPAEIQAKVTDAKAQIAKGTIQVKTAMGMDQKAIDDLRNSVKP